MYRNALILLVALATATMAAAQAELKSLPDDQVYKGAPLQASWDAMLPPPAPEAVLEDLYKWAGQVRFLGKDLGGAALEKELRERLRIKMAGDPLEMQVLVNLKGAADAERLRAVVDAAPTALGDIMTKHARLGQERVLAQLNDEVQQRRQTVRELEHLTAKLRDELRVRSGFADVTAEGIQRALSGMDQELRKLQLDLVGQNARQKALEAATAKVAKQAEARVESDPIAAELKKIVAVRIREVEQLTKLAEAGKVAASELAAAESAVAEATSKLLERRERSAHGGGADLLMRLNEELLMLSILTAETSARLDFVKAAVDKAKPSLELLGELERRRMESVRAESALADAEKRLTDARINIGVMPPSVKVRTNEGLFGGEGGGSGGAR